MKANIILVNTYQENFQQGIFSLGNSRKNQPLSLTLIAAILEKQKHKVNIIDANLLRLSHQKVAKKIAKDKPKLIIINTASIDRWECPLPTIKQPRLLSKEIKKQYPQALIIAIGPHGTITPKWVLKKCPSVDFLVRGEPEAIFQKIAKNFPFASPKSSDKGGSFLKKLLNINNPIQPYLDNLDSLPLPAYHLLPMKKYGPLSDHYNGEKFTGQSHPFSIILTSRGCPGQCIFCFKKMYQQQKTYRFRSPKNVVDEIELLIKKHGIKAIYIQDLSFCIIQKRVIAICQEIKKRKLNFSWGCEARFDSISIPLLIAMKEAGCCFINFGLESGSEKIIFQCQKNIKIEVIEKTIANCQKLKIAVGCFKLLGLPGETKKTFIETLSFMIKNKITIPYPFPINLPLPYPGTKLHQQAQKQFKEKINWEDTPRFAGKVNTNFFKQITIEEIQRLTYQYKLIQDNKQKNRHYFRLLLNQNIAKFKSLPNKILTSRPNRSFSKK